MQSAARYIGIGGLPAAAGIACTLINVRTGLNQMLSMKYERRQEGGWERAPQFTTWVPEWVSESCDDNQSGLGQSRDLYDDAGDPG
ncbi:hypothetical protein EVJ58_g8017 [Rhodofomes roseus]|uniref:Uncharacterized protein n=1 Tax=Rhodofomes roseus TaxID=34475 RepID=A0A4Y9Y1L8_9APHY|nr:hypothetical protein EVJ58_g8017 [Rhodofomes roseus]